MENLVLFKGHIGGMTIILDKEAPFEEIITQFNDKLQASKKFFQGTLVNLHFKGRQLSEDEEEVLLDVLANQQIVEVAYIQLVGKNDRKIEPINLEERQEVPGNWYSMTHYHYGIVRSGQHVEYKGSVVILGDVNPGGMVTAGGNIIVLGALKGLVKAGQSNQVKHPFVIALQMFPLQITIGNLITQPPADEKVEQIKTQYPQIAYASQEHIYVEEIDYKTLQHMLE